MPVETLSTRPTILLLSLDKQQYWDEMYSGLVDSMAAKATIKRATSPRNMCTYLESNTPSAVLVTDPTIVKPKRALDAVRKSVVNYVRNGGTVVLATQFSSLVRPLDLNAWFRGSWDLRWQSGDYHRTTVYLNPECQVRHLTQAGLPEYYSQKAVFLKFVSEDAAVYFPSRTSRTESHVFPPEPVDCGQTPVVFAKVGAGWLGYVGDVNTESESRAVILAMCGL